MRVPLILMMAALLAGCDPNVQRDMALESLNRTAPVGADFAKVAATLKAKGFEAKEPDFGPPRDLSGWDRCLTRDVSYPLALAGGQRWLCVLLDGTGRIIDKTVDEFSFGV